MKLVEFSAGKPLFGHGQIEGWDICVHESRDARERTLRNAFLAALQAEHEGREEVALAIWNTKLEDGSTVIAHSVEALPTHVQWLHDQVNGEPAPAVQEKREPTALEKAKAAKAAEGKRAKVEDAAERKAIKQAQPDLAVLRPNEVKHMVDSRSESLGRPCMTRWQATAARGAVLLYEWDDEGEWLAFEINAEDRTATPLRGLPVEIEVQAHSAKAKRMGKRSTQFSPRREAPENQEIQQALHKSAAMRSYPTELETELGGTLPASFPRLMVDRPSACAFVSAILESEQVHQAKARSAKTFKACALCMSPILAGVKWIAKNKTTRRRLHLSCFEPMAEHLIEERKEAERTGV